MSNALALLDMLVLATLLLSMLLGAWRGLVYELLMLVGWVVAFFAARLLVPQLLPQASAYFSNAAPQALYAGVFIVLTFAWGLLASLAKKLIQMVGLRPVDRVFGACFGVVRALVLLLVLAMVVQAAGWQSQSWWQQSTSAAWLEQGLAQALPSLPQSWGRMLHGTQ